MRYFDCNVYLLQLSLVLRKEAGRVVSEAVGPRVGMPGYESKPMRQRLYWALVLLCGKSLKKCSCKQRRDRPSRV